MIAIIICILNLKCTFQVIKSKELEKIQEWKCKLNCAFVNLSLLFWQNYYTFKGVKEERS